MRTGSGRLVCDAVLDEFAGDAVAAEEVFQLKLERWDEAEVVEQGGAQESSDVADGLHDVFGKFAGASQAVAQFGVRAGEERLRVGDFDLQEGQALADFVVQFARESAAAFLFDFQQAGGELLQLLFRLLHGGEVTVGLAFEVIGVPQADAGHQDAEQYAEAKHQQESFGRAPACAGEFALAVFQHALVGGSDFAEGIVEFAAARHHFALEKCDLGVVAGVEHGLREAVWR